MPPGEGEYVPVPHAMQRASLLALLCLPGSHCVHVPVDPASYPAKHRHTEIESAAVVFEKLNSGQGVHKADPMLALNLPGSHAAHDSAPLPPVYPD